MLAWVFWFDVPFDKVPPSTCTRRNFEINNYNFSHKRQIFSHNGHMRLPAMQLPWTSGKRYVVTKDVQVDTSCSCSHILLATITDISSIDVAHIVVGLCDYCCD